MLGSGMVVLLVVVFVAGVGLWDCFVLAWASALLVYLHPVVKVPEEVLRWPLSHLTYPISSLGHGCGSHLSYPISSLGRRECVWSVLLLLLSLC